jgi:DNA-directed RNA polymerase I, II, and III subunit RPABC2
MSDLDPPFEFENDDGKEVDVVFDNHGRQTTRRLTKFERAKILGMRANLISKGSPIFVDACGETNSLRIAIMEEKQGKLPFIIRRFFPPGDKYEDWSIDDLISL